MKLTSQTDFDPDRSAMAHAGRLSHPGFAVGTEIITSAGAIPIEELRPGDRVLTKDRGNQTLQRIAHREIALEGYNQDRPVRIAPDALGLSKPQQVLFVHPEQKIALRHAMLDLYFGQTEVLICARDVIGQSGIDYVSKLDAVSYIYLDLGAPDLIYAGALPLGLFAAGDTPTRNVLGAEEACVAVSVLRAHGQMASSDGFPLH